MSEPMDATNEVFASPDISSALQGFRALVPVAAESNQTYLNASFQPPMNLKVQAAINQFLTEATTLPHPKPEWQARAVQAQAHLAEYLNVAPSSLDFIRDTTEGLNLFQRSLKLQPGSNVVVLEDEHPNHLYGWLAIADQGLEVRRVKVEGDDPSPSCANANTFAAYVDEKTVAIGISSVMFHNGQLNDVGDISAVYRPRGIHVLVDMTQHVGVAPIDLTAWNVSTAAFGCHKGLGAPTGLGCLYIDPAVLGDLHPTPPIVGAGAVSNVPGTLVADPNVTYWPTTKRYEHLNVSLLSAAALDAALSLITGEIGIIRLEKHFRSLGRELILRCRSIGVTVAGSNIASQRAPHIYVLRLMHPDWQSHFRGSNIYVSHYRCGVRVSLGFYNNLDDIDILARCIESGLAKGITAS
jgi:selenocysteine lyase/cysteine desulfurase